MFPRIYLVPFCSSKLFLQCISSSFLSEKMEVLRTSVFLNSKCLTCFYLKEYPLKVSNKRIHISVLFNLFISLIELEDQLKYQMKEHTLKFKIDKITYSKSQSRTIQDVSKISIQCILIRLYERTLQVVYRDSDPSIEELLGRDSSATLHLRKISQLMTDTLRYL